MAVSGSTCIVCRDEYMVCWYGNKTVYYFIEYDEECFQTAPQLV